MTKNQPVFLIVIIEGTIRLRFRQAVAKNSGGKKKSENRKNPFQKFVESLAKKFISTKCQKNHEIDEITIQSTLQGVVLYTLSFFPGSKEYMRG